jgi:nucleotide-binding universal stress UspA family protein
MKTIVALIDFTDITPKVIDHSIELARACGSEVILVHVVPPLPVVMDYVPASITNGDDSEARLADLMALQASMKARGVVVTTRILKGPVLETLLASMAGLKPDLIIMGSHGHGTLYNLIVGTVTEGFIKHSNWPVTIIPQVRVAGSQPVMAAESEKTGAGETSQLIGAVGGAPLPL